MERRLAAILAADMVGYSRLMEQDEDGILHRQTAYRREVIDPEIAQNRGRIVKTTGDGMLAEFASARDAVRCALDIQKHIGTKERDSADADRIQYRVGINLGDMIFDGDDVFGDGVNVAARLEGLAEPGGICISDPVYQAAGERVPEPFRDLGSQRVKNISRPIRVWHWSPEARIHREPEKMSRQQRVQFCTSADGTRIAWASVGEGLNLLKAPHHMNHIEFEWSSPIWGPTYNAFAERFRFTRFDQRGNGLSDWDVADISPKAMFDDMEAVVAAADLDRFAIFAASQGAAYAVDYALAYPEKVACIIFAGGYLRGRRKRNDPEQENIQSMGEMMIHQGWGSPNPIFRQFFLTSFMPDGTREQQMQFDELQRISTNADNALRISRMNADIDHLQKARDLTVPCLVMHAAGDRVAPIEEGLAIARAIPGAQFVELPGDNHIFLEGDAGYDTLFSELTAFVHAHP